MKRITIFGNLFPKDFLISEPHMKRIIVNFILLFWLPLVSAQSVTLVGTLPQAVNETSGVIIYNGSLITHNDSGNSTQLFEIDLSTLEITRTIEISNATNVDWEDITQDDSYIYIGDIGNINGNRTDLVIYRVAKSDFDSSDVVTADRIDFNYEDQQSFLSTPNSDWDAEALTVVRGQLTIFTKRWSSGGTTAYAVPGSPGQHAAVNIGTAQVNGLVTAATYNPDSDVLYLLGYSEFLQPFLLRFENPPGPLSFGLGGEYSVPDIGFSQTEGMGFLDFNTYYITSERFENQSPPVVLAASLFLLKTEDTPVESEPPPEEEPAPEEPDEDPDPEPEPQEGLNDELIIYREFGSDVLQYVLNTEDDLFGRAIYDLQGRRIEYIPESEIESNSIDISTLGSSIYFLTFYLRTKILSKPFISN